MVNHRAHTGDFNRICRYNRHVATLSPIPNEFAPLIKPPTEETNATESARYLTTGRGDRYGFLPLPKGKLVNALIDRITKKLGAEAPAERLLNLLDVVIHLDNRERLERLKQDYAEFDPDHEIEPSALADAAQVNDRVKRFLVQFDELVERANFIRLSDEEVKAAIAQASHYGLRVTVDFESFEAMHVYARGEAIERRLSRHWRKFYRKTLLDTPVYKRMVVALRMKQTASSKGEMRPQFIYLKMFKDIPKVDVEMLLPTTNVEMTWFDKGQIFVPTMSGLAYSLFKISAAAWAITQLTTGALLTIGGLLVGSCGYALKTFFGYARTRDRYQLRLTRRLFFQNLYNNAALLFRLQDSAEGQEYREASLAYVLMLGEGVGAAISVSETGRRVERFLQKRFDLEVEFDAIDAVASLSRLGLIENVGGEGEQGGLWRPTEIDKAISLLESKVTRHVGLMDD